MLLCVRGCAVFDILLGICSACIGVSSSVVLIMGLDVPGNAPIARPPIIRSTVPGTWAYDTMSRRVREEILMRVYEQNKAELARNERAKSMLDILLKELTIPHEANMGPLQVDPNAQENVDLWNENILAPYAKETWLSTPWLYAEFYFYRRLTEAFDFFGTGYDPFEGEKQRGVITSMPSMGHFSELLNQNDDLNKADGIRLWVSTSLWGNRMDLSLWPATSSSDCTNDKHRSDADVINLDVITKSKENLLCDDLNDVVQILLSDVPCQRRRRIDIVVDNAGFELFTDLCLADYLVECGIANQIVLHLKGHPTFVSDAMAKDLKWMVNVMAECETGHHADSLSTLGKRWKSRIEKGEWDLRENLFWAQPQPFWEIPKDISQDMKAYSRLVFVKGDANYRRLLGDRKWAFDTPFLDVCGYFPTNLCALRALKAEIGCGMPEEKTRAARALDEKWLVSGRFGVIQCFSPNEKNIG